MSILYQVDDRNLLNDLLDGTGAFLAPAAVIEGLTPEQAAAKPQGLPHSIAEIVAHMCFWQEWFNSCAARGFTGAPEHAPEGWPAVAADGWEDVRSRFLNSIAEAKSIAATSDSLGKALLPSGVDIPPLAKESYGSGILHGAFHSGHHLGQIITIRQLMGLWPPAAGSYTW
jgi:uncharacterized damage-inducible protein DinB